MRVYVHSALLYQRVEETDPVGFWISHTSVSSMAFLSDWLYEYAVAGIGIVIAVNYWAA